MSRLARLRDKARAHLAALPPVSTIARDGAGLCAVASIGFGAWLIYPPAGFIVTGVIVLVGVFLAARGDAVVRSPGGHRDS